MQKDRIRDIGDQDGFLLLTPVGSSMGLDDVDMG